jgi:histidinol-phosphate aminotransferase
MEAAMATPDIIRDEIAALSAYPVQAAAGMIKLDAMENPYAFPEALRPGLAAALASATLNRYPSAAAEELKQAIRAAMQVPPELELLLGNGSDEIIQLIAMACARPGAALLSVEPAFVMFRMIATFCGLDYLGVPLRSDFSIDEAAMLATIKAKKPALSFIAYPNNPSGNLFDRAVIRRLIKACGAHGGLVVIDEAYFAFSSESFLDEITRYPNVVLMRTVSKLGLAGARLGILIGRRDWLDEFDKLRLPYNINVLTQAAATFAMRHYGALLAQAAELNSERERLGTAIDRMAGIARFPSQANFILVKVADADQTFRALLSRKILVKNTGKTHPLMANTLRLTVGTPAENDAMIGALRESV